MKLSVEELKNFFIGDENDTKRITSTVSDLKMIIQFNYSDKQYIINSSTSVYNENSETDFIINIVLSPNIAVSFCTEMLFVKLFGSDIKRDYVVIPIYDNDFIVDYNVKTLTATINNSPYFVVGRIDELNEAISIYKKSI